MNNKMLSITKINLMSLKTVFITLAIICGQYIIKLILSLLGADFTKQVEVGIGSFLWLFIPGAAIVISSNNFKKFINLGMKRKDFITGSLFNYILMSAVISLLSILFTNIFDQFIINLNRFEGVINITEFLEWNDLPIFIVFLRQFALLLFIAALTHSLVSVKDIKYGWTLYAVLITAIIAIGAVPVTRNLFLYLANIIIFTPNSLLQITTCTVLAILIYLISVPVFMKKNL